ncbi:MAG: sigma-54-dependent Fis family transcriptional regulator, partial [Proteobacteria bacterium]
FLDEIGDMSLKAQAKVLRILQEQKFERVGGTQTITVDVRIVAATNKDLKEEIKRGRFREDLFYRLNVIPFHIPPLRERSTDINLLAEYFMNEFSGNYLRKPRVFPLESQALLAAYPWPGNVRELKNLIERILILTTENEDGTPIVVDSLLTHLDQDAVQAGLAGRADSIVRSQGAQSMRSLRDARSEFEKDFIIKTLRENEWNVSKASQVLGIERSHLHKKMKNFGIDGENE